MQIMKAAEKAREESIVILPIPCAPALLTVNKKEKKKKKIKNN